MDMGLAVYLPTTVEHIPGLSNDIADALSRQFESTPAAFPEVLLGVDRHFPATRDASWWIAAEPGSA